MIGKILVRFILGFLIGAGLILMMNGCGPIEKHDKRHDGSKNCTVDGNVIRCPDGTETVILNGKDGAAGKDGESIQGPKGDTGEAGADGQSIQGATGTPGTSCSVVQTPAGAVLSCTDGSTATVSNGQNGSNGAAGSLITPVIPCPSVPGNYPEVLLCIDQKLYAVFAPGNSDVRYVQLPPGSYISTDGRQCAFTVTNACNIQ